MHRESLDELVARVNASAYIPPLTAFTAVRRSSMAQKVKLAKGKEFRFRSGVQGSKYPWKEWLNGDLLLLEQSEGQKDDKGTVVAVTAKKDFEVSPEAMRFKCKVAGRKQYKHVDTSLRDADGVKLKDALIVRARDMTADERAEEDLLRAEEKEATSERRAEEKAAAKQLREEGVGSPTRAQITARRQANAARGNGQPTA